MLQKWEAGEGEGGGYTRVLNAIVVRHLATRPPEDKALEPSFRHYPRLQT